MQSQCLAGPMVLRRSPSYTQIRVFLRKFAPCHHPILMTCHHRVNWFSSNLVNRGEPCPVSGFPQGESAMSSIARMAVFVVLGSAFTALALVVAGYLSTTFG